MKESTPARHGAWLLLEGPPAVSARLMKAGRRAFREEPVCSAALAEPAAIHLHYTRPHATTGRGVEGWDNSTEGDQEGGVVGERRRV